MRKAMAVLLYDAKIHVVVGSPIEEPPGGEEHCPNPSGAAEIGARVHAPKFLELHVKHDDGASYSFTYCGSFLIQWSNDE